MLLEGVRNAILILWIVSESMDLDDIPVFPLEDIMYPYLSKIQNAEYRDGFGFVSFRFSTQTVVSSRLY